MHPEQNRTKTKQKYSIEPLCVQSQPHIHVHVYARTQQSMRSWRRPRTNNKTQNILNRNTGSDSYTTHKPQRWTQRGRDRITNERRVDEDALHCGQKTWRATYDTPQHMTPKQREQKRRKRRHAKNKSNATLPLPRHAKRRSRRRDARNAMIGRSKSNRASC